MKRLHRIPINMRGNKHKAIFGIVILVILGFITLFGRRLSKTSASITVNDNIQKNESESEYIKLSSVNNSNEYNDGEEEEEQENAVADDSEREQEEADDGSEDNKPDAINEQNKITQDNNNNNVNEDQHNNSNSSNTSNIENSEIVKITTKPPERYKKLHGFQYCTHLDGSVFDMYADIHSFGGSVLELGKLDSDLINLIDYQANLLNSKFRKQGELEPMVRRK
jgi:hypothetical protein